MTTLSHLQKKAIAFFTDPVSPIPLSIFRILIASFTLLQAFLWYPDWLAFFGKDAWIQWEISQALIPDLSLHMAQVAQFFSRFGLDETQSVMLFFWLYVASAFGLLWGLFTRFWAVTTWFCHYILIYSIDVYVYGVDIFLHIALFYTMLMPLNKAYSLDKYFGLAVNRPAWVTTLSLRVLQIHLCLIYLSAGHEKLFSMDWWQGNTLWRSLVQPDFRQFNLEWLVDYPFIPKVLSWFTMFIETFYFIGMWIPRVRIFWFFGILSLHLGISIFLGLWLFGLIMILLSISAFGYVVWHDLTKKGIR